ncbi:hypothetical protein F2Q68_00019494 [Brassica cretica]|uniref:Pectin acetylesterase n=1 Tax=Brassica cretica TaxID=69181 RepID=A0A8S9FZV1_BRACR|nr:hypothetical protein F2Q68_00019494 [Brassica cretica]
MNAFLWSWSLTGFFLLSILANGVLGSDEMDLFNLINGTNVFQKQDDGADVLVVGLTLVQTAAAEGAVCLDGSVPGYHLYRGSGSGANNWIIQLEATLIQGSISEHRLNTFRHLLREGTTYEISGFDSSLIKIYVSVHRLNTFRELDLKEGALYELSGFDVTRSNNHFKLCNSNVAIRLNQSAKMVEVPAVANPR